MLLLIISLLFIPVMALGQVGDLQNSLQQKIAVLTSPEFEGRDAPGPFADKTADWIVGQLDDRPENCALIIQTVPLLQATMAPQFSLISLSSRDKMFLAKWGDRYYQFPKRLNSTDLSLATLFCGYGLSIPETQRNDYPAEVRGKTAIVLAGSDLPAEKAGMRGNAAFKAAAAERAGALALVVVYTDSLWVPKELTDKIEDAKLPVIDLSGSKPEFPVAYIHMPGATIDELRKYSDLKLRLNFNRSTESPSRNVILIVPGTIDEWVVVGAHYDHLGKDYPGADDNASGVAGLLELAGRFQSRQNLHRGVIFAWFTAEEDGLLGARWFAENPPVDRGKIAAMINLDMIGRNGFASMRDASKSGAIPEPGYAAAYFSAGSPTLRDVIRASSDSGGLSVTYQPVNSFRHFGDAGPFHDAQIPTMHIFSGFHSDYHLKSDTPDKIDYTKLTDMIDFTGRVVENLIEIPERPPFDPSIKVESPGMGY